MFHDNLFLLQEPVLKVTEWTFGQVLATAIVSIAVSTLTAVITFFLTRRKTDSEIDKTDSDTIANYVRIISELQKDLDGWIKKVRETREESIRGEETIRMYKREREQNYDTAAKVLRIAKDLEDRLIDNPLRRLAISIVEYLTYLKGKLDPDDKEPRRRVKDA